MEWIPLRPLWLLEHLWCEESGLLWGKENGNHHGQRAMLPILGSHLVANLSSLPLSMTATEERASSLATYHLPTMSRCPCHASLLIVKTLSRQPLPSPSSAKKTLAKWGKHLHSALLDVNHLLHVLLFLDAVDHLIARPRTSHVSEMCTKLKAPKFETTTIWLQNLSISIYDVLNQEWCNPLSVHSRQGHSGKWKRKREISRILLCKFANFQVPSF